jgi:histone-binding protein RBBP4
MADTNGIQEDEIQNEVTIKEEYELWRKNCRYMYEFVAETALTWPSLTIQWLPDHVDEDDVINSRLLLGTHTSGEDTNYLKLANTQLPSNKTAKANTRLKIIKKFENNFEINRARYMPQQPEIVATINGGGEIDLYNLEGSTDGSKSSFSHFTPHSENGYGLAWSPHSKGLLLTASDDKSVVITDTNNGGTTSIFRSTTDHQQIVNDAKWHHFDSNLFASVSDDKYTILFDVRSKNPVSRYYGVDEINCLSFSTFSHNLLAIGGTNSNINLLDIRKMSDKTELKAGLLHSMMGHSDAITSLEFSPHNDGVLASGSQDRRLIIWDLFKVGEEQQQEDAEDGCPELYMMHAGHTGAVTDLSWCPYKPWTLASVADDNLVHVWEVGQSILNADKQEDLNDDDLE